MMAAAVIFGLISSAYLFIHELVERTTYPAHPSKIGLDCPDPSLQAPQQNPNKILFISCGGFLD